MCLCVIYCLVMFVYLCLCLHVQTPSAQREQVRRYLTVTIHYTPNLLLILYWYYIYTTNQLRMSRKFQFNLLYIVLCPLQPQPCLGGPQLTREKHLLLQSLLDRYHNFDILMITLFKAVLLEIKHHCMCFGMQQGTQSSPNLHHGPTQCLVPDNSASPSPAPKTQHSFPDNFVSGHC